MNMNHQRFLFALIALGALFLLAILPDPWLPVMVRDVMPIEDLLAGLAVGVLTLVVLGRRSLKSRRPQLALAVGVGGMLLAGVTRFVL